MTQSEKTAQQMAKDKMDIARYSAWIEDPTTIEMVGRVEALLKQAQGMLENMQLVDREQLAEVRVTIMVCKLFVNGPIEGIQALADRVEKLRKSLNIQLDDGATQPIRIA